MNNKNNDTKCKNDAATTKQLIKSWSEQDKKYNTLCTGKIWSGTIIPKSQ